MFANLTVARRLTAAFAVVFAVLVASVVLGLDRLAAIDAMVDRIVGTDWQKSVLANEAIALMSANARETYHLFLTRDRAPIKQRIAANGDAVSERLAKLEQLVRRPEAKALLAEIATKRNAFVSAYSQTVRLLDEGKEAEAAEVMTNQVTPTLESLLDSAGRLMRFQAQVLEETGRGSQETYRNARTTMLAFLGVMIVVTAAMGFAIVRSVTRPLGGEPAAARAVVMSIASGDLTHEVPVRPADDDSLLAGMRDMQRGLREMIVNLQRNADELSGAARQVAAASAQLASGTGEQSEAASSMAAAVEQMTASINHVSDSANEARTVTAEAGDQSRTGRAVIAETVSEMEAIAGTVTAASATIHAVGENSARISGIVQVIKDVADQTNLLALNAAIEAARAGEQGRGFAVVADEVRRLAERTAVATTEIATMIEAMQTSVRSAVDTMAQATARTTGGVEKANRAGEAMRGIGESAEHTIASVNEISAALNEQSAASSGISANVERIAQMSEENNAATREAAETARRLEALADQTRAAVGRFRV